MFILEIIDPRRISEAIGSQSVANPKAPESILQSLVLGNNNLPKATKSPKSKTSSSKEKSRSSRTITVKESISPAAKRTRRIKRITKLLMKTAKGERGSYDEQKLKTALYNLLKLETGKDITQKKKDDIDKFFNDMRNDKPTMDVNKDGRFDHNDLIALWKDEPAESAP